MKPQPFIRAACFVVAMAASSTLFAQVKIGTNPTTIDPANNLEVESSTAGNKVSINKTTGKLTIADGSQGAAKILTSDANGTATWQSPAAQNSPVVLSVRKTTVQSLPKEVYTQLLFDTKVFDKGTNFDLSNSRFTAPSNGYYIISIVTSNVDNAVPAGTLYGQNVILYKNGIAYRVGTVNKINGGEGQVSDFTAIVSANAGDYFTIYVYSHAAPSQMTACWFDAYKISELN